MTTTPAASGPAGQPTAGGPAPNTATPAQVAPPTQVAPPAPVPALPPAVPATGRQKVLSAAGAVGLLVIGALLGAAVPRLIEAVFPPTREIPNVAIIAHPSGHNGYTYFVQAPDWVQLAAEMKQCSNSDGDRPLFDDRQDCESDVMDRFGGIPFFGSASIDITNAQAVSVQITEVRTVVEKRTPARFAASFEPQQGGPIGTALGFNLDRDSFRARLMTEAENVVPPLTAPPADSRPAYFQGQHLEIEPGRSEHLYVASMATYNGIVEWHIEIEYEALNADGKTQRMMAIVKPPGRPFKGARSATPPAEVRDQL